MFRKFGIKSYVRLLSRRRLNTRKGRVIKLKHSPIRYKKNICASEQIEKCLVKGLDCGECNRQYIEKNIPDHNSEPGNIKILYTGRRRILSFP